MIAPLIVVFDHGFMTPPKDHCLGEMLVSLIHHQNIGVNFRVTFCEFILSHAENRALTLTKYTVGSGSRHKQAPVADFAQFFIICR